MLCRVRRTSTSGRQRIHLHIRQCRRDHGVHHRYASMLDSPIEHRCLSSGWNMILEYVIGMLTFVRRRCRDASRSLGAASTARALSAYFDSLINFAMKDYFTANFPMHSETFAPYADLFAMSLCLAITGESLANGGPAARSIRLV